MTDPVAQYTRREMLELVRKRPAPTTFLQDMFVKRTTVHGTKYLEIDQIFGNNVSAGYVNRNSKGHVVGKDGFKNLIHVAPYVKELFDYSSSDVDERLAGQTQYDSSDPIAAFISEALLDIENRIVRLEEAQVAESLISGTVTVSGEGVAYTVDFDQADTHLLETTGTARWTETTRDILANWQTWGQVILDTGSPLPDVCLLDPLAAKIVLRDTAITNLLDNKRVEMGMINPRVLRGQNATYLGHIYYDGVDLDLYSYGGKRTVVSAGTPTSKPYLDSYRCILANSQMDYRMHYGKIENLLAPNFRGKRFTNQWTEQDGSAGHISIESAPLAGLHDPGSVVSVHVTAAA